MSDIVYAAILIGMGLTFLAIAIDRAARTVASQRRRAEERRMRVLENFAKRVLEAVEPQMNHTGHDPTRRTEEDE